MIAKLLKSFLKTLFPPTCNVCTKKLPDQSIGVCDGCLSTLPLTNNWFFPHNNLYDKVIGDVDIVGAVSLFHYQMGSDYSNIILNLKFKNQRKLAYEMGLLMGRYIKDTPAISEVEAIVAIPLHRSRRRMRGYNQSDFIARGLSEALGIPVVEGAVVRKVKSKVQSLIKGKYQRVQNVKDIFSVVDASALENRRVLLIDDVITTGATISSCANTMNKKITGIEIVIGSLASV